MNETVNKKQSEQYHLLGHDAMKFSSSQKFEEKSERSCSQLCAGYLLDLIFVLEDEGSTIFQGIGELLPTTYYPSQKTIFFGHSCQILKFREEK
jgi:hypothetical protein